MPVEALLTSPDLKAGMHDFRKMAETGGRPSPALL